MNDDQIKETPDETPITEPLTQDTTPPPAKTVLGIPKKNYIKLTYILLMTASALGIPAMFIGGLSGIVGLIGLVGVVLALLGFFMFAIEFTDAQLSHFKYVGVVFIASFFLGVILSIILGSNGVLALVISPLINLFALAAMFAGYRLNEKRTPASKESVLNELKSLKP
ncbi:MAG: hypothetical protein GW778_02955 [Alphaproteobacteria bacterium]|nr:hypothetical protein [Alphaproteobacteria bacterium]